MIKTTAKSNEEVNYVHPGHLRSDKSQECFCTEMDDADLMMMINQSINQSINLDFSLLSPPKRLTNVQGGYLTPRK